MKIGQNFSSLPNFAKQLIGAGARGLILFNRYLEADINHDHLLNADGLDNYLRRYVPRLNDQQHPRGEIRFNDTVFAAGG